MEQNAPSTNALPPKSRLELAEQLKNQTPSDSLISQLTGNPFFTAVRIFTCTHQVPSPADDRRDLGLPHLQQLLELDSRDSNMELP